MFGRILETEHNSDIELEVIHRNVSFSSINDNGANSISKSRNGSEIVSTCNQLKKKRQKNVHDYSHKYIDDFKLIVVNTPPKLTDK